LPTSTVKTVVRNTVLLVPPPRSFTIDRCFATELTVLPLLLHLPSSLWAATLVALAGILNTILQNFPSTRSHTHLLLKFPSYIKNLDSHIS
jgi:hypothetical protein